MGGNAMYYGLNALSNNMILLDRKQSRCPNGLVFGTPGSGTWLYVPSSMLEDAKNLIRPIDEIPEQEDMQ